MKSWHEYRRIVDSKHVVIQYFGIHYKVVYVSQSVNRIFKVPCSCLAFLYQQQTWNYFFLFVQLSKVTDSERLNKLLLVCLTHKLLINYTIPEHCAASRTSCSSPRKNWYTVVFQLPVGMLIVSQISVGSTHVVPGTLTTAGDRTKLVRIRSPPRMAAGGTLMAFPSCQHPCI